MSESGMRVALWDAINEYAEACGADTSAHVGSVRRMNAVARVERVVFPYECGKVDGYRDHRALVEAARAVLDNGSEIMTVAEDRLRRFPLIFGDKKEQAKARAFFDAVRALRAAVEGVG